MFAEIHSPYFQQRTAAATTIIATTLPIRRCCPRRKGRYKKVVGHILGGGNYSIEEYYKIVNLGLLVLIVAIHLHAVY